MGFELTERDREIVTAVGEHGRMTVSQIKRRFFCRWDGESRVLASDQAVYRRLRHLCSAGLLRREKVLYASPAVYIATHAGMSYAGVGLRPVQRPNLNDYAHDLAVVDLWLDFEEAVSSSGRGRLSWIPERRIWSVRRPGAQTGKVPDALVVGPGGERWAVELEISGKETKRYVKDLAGYLSRMRDRLDRGRDDLGHLESYVESSGKLDGVIYYCASTAILGRVRQAAKEARRGYLAAEERRLTPYLILFAAADERPLFVPRFQKATLAGA